MSPSTVHSLRSFRSVYETSVMLSPKRHRQFSSYRRPRELPKSDNRYGGVRKLIAAKKNKLVADMNMIEKLGLGGLAIWLGLQCLLEGWQFSAAVAGMLSANVAGRVLVTAYYNIPIRPMMLVPFTGAANYLRRRPCEAWQAALIAFGGCALGSLLTIGIVIAGQVIDYYPLYLIGQCGATMNLLALMPLAVTDGVLIASALDKRVLIAGLGMAGIKTYSLAMMQPVLFAANAVAANKSINWFFQHDYTPPPKFSTITPVTRALLSAGYFGLLGVLLYAMEINHAKYSEWHLLKLLEDLFKVPMEKRKREKAIKLTTRRDDALNGE